MSTSFEHSSMKSSFSLSSLRSAAAPPGGRCEQLERPYHSLTKKRKEPCREAWRRSWGSAASGGSAVDDLWPLLQHHYDYIMDNQIIDSCKEANSELMSHAASPHGPRLLNPTSSFNRQWSLHQLISEFSELCQWLTHVQEEIYSSPENLSSRKLRMSRMTELLSVEPRRAKFIEQANAILERIPEASAEVTWRIEHLNVKWASLRLLLSPEQQYREGDSSDTVDTAHEIRCLRRWLHCMEGRLPPPSMAAARGAPYHELLRKLSEHKVLQRDVECHGRIVSSVVRLCGGGDAVRALERRWHLLYLRAIEWQCHLEACLTRIDNQGGVSAEAASDSDDEPVLKQPRLSRKGSPRRQRTPVNARRRETSLDSRQSASEEEQEYALTYQWRGFGSDCESELERGRLNMADERRVPGAGHDIAHRNTDQTVPMHDDQIDGLELRSIAIHDKIATPPTVIKRKKPVDTSKFNQTDRKSKHLATFYFRHHDTDSDRQPIETEKSQEESSEEEWTYVDGAKIGNEDSTDIMTSSVEIQCELPIDDKKYEEIKAPSPKPKLESSTPDLLKVESTRNKDIDRLVNQAEELVQKQALAKKKGPRSFKPLAFEEDNKNASRNKMSRIKEWLNQSTEDKNDTNQGTESYDASGEYTTESEVDTSLTSEERNLHSSMDMSTSTCTVTPTHHAKVQLRKKRGGNSARPWSVSCLSQLSGAHASLVATPTAGDVAAMSHNMSISESALNTLASPQRVIASNSNSKLRGSSTTVQGHVSSTNTMTEACTSCVEANDKQCWLRRKRLKLRRNNTVARRERLVKSLSFCGRFSPERDDKLERSAASDPATSRKSRFDTTSTSGNDSDEEPTKQQLAAIAHLRKSIEKTHISTIEPDSAIPEQNEADTVAPSFKLGPAGGPVRPRLARSLERERNFIALSLGDPSRLWDLSIDKDSDVDKSVTAGTEEHSSFSEQAWDFYQEKYNSEPYSEAPDSDAARRLLEFGDDYRAFLDSQSDCCSSLSAQPENDQSPSGTRRRRPPSDASRERSLPRYKRPTRNSPVETPARKPKKSMSSAERKKSLLDSLERSRNNTSIESNEGVRRRKPSENERKNNKRSPEFDLLNVQALSRRRHSSNLTSDEINSSLEYTEVNNRPDILDSLSRRRRTEKDGETELQKVVATELRRRSTESGDSEDECSSPKGHRGRWSSEEEGEVRALVRRSSAALAAAEQHLARHDAEPDLLRAADYVRTFDTDFSSCYELEDELSCVTRRPACFRARLCLAVAAFSVLVIVYIHLQ